nr:hypothetical protein [Tanacetum cinerariifolium]
MTGQLLDSMGPIPNKTSVQALEATQTMADHSRKWHDGLNNRMVRNGTYDEIIAIANKLDSLERYMKKLLENVHAIQVGCETCVGAHLDKECPLHEEVESIEGVKDKVCRLEEQGVLNQWYCYRDNERRNMKGKETLFSDFLQIRYGNSKIDDTTREGVILNGDSPVPTRIVEGVLQLVAPTTAEQKCQDTDGSYREEIWREQRDQEILKDPFEATLEIHGVSLSQEDVNLKFLQSLPSEWKTHTLIWSNKADLEEQSLDDLFNSLKIYEDEVKHSSSTCTTTQDLAFVSSSYTDSTTELFSAAASVSAICAKMPVSSLPNVDSLRSYDWSYQAEEEPANYALMNFSSSSSSSDNELSPTKPTQDLSHKNRPTAPIIEDWVSDSEDESETKAPQPVSAVVPKSRVTQPRDAKPFVTKSKSPIRRHLTHSQSLKTSNSSPRVTAIKALVGVIDSGCSRHMTGNMSYLSDFEELNGRYVAIGGNPKGGKISGKGKIRTDSLLPIPFWAEAVNTACYVQNRVLVTKPHNKTPYELLHGRTPSIGFMRPFGCPVTILNTQESLCKFEGKVDEGFLVGYFVNSKAFRVFNSRTRIVQETLYVNFLENKPIVAGSGPTWLFDIDSLTRTINYQPVTVRNQTNPSAGFQDKFTTKKAGEEIGQQYVLYPVWSSGSTNPQNNDGDAAFDGKEPNFDAKKLDSEVNVSPSNSAQSRKQDDKTKKEAKGKIPIVGQNYPNSTNTFSVAGPSNAVASPTYGKSSFIDASQLPDDPDMPELEDIIYFDDEDDVGAEADFNNLETLLQSVIFQQQEFTKIIMYHKLLEGPKRVHQALKDLSWIEAMQGKIDQTLFIKRQKGDILLVQIYVDDIIFGATNKDLCKYFEKLMKGKFQMSSMEELTFFLGLQVKQKKDGIFASQDKYVAEILRKFGLTERKSASTPIDTEKPLLKDPDVCACARFQVTPKASHLYVVKRIFRYLKGKPHLGLLYPKDLPFDLVAYSDSDYAGASLDRKSTTGGCQFLGCRLISWQCKKQTVVATSSTEAEYVAAAIKQVNDITRLQALVDKKKVVVTEATIRDALCLDDAEGVDRLPNEEIFVELARMGYEKLRVGKRFSGVETPLFEGMLVEQHGDEEGDADEYVEEVNAGDVAEEYDSAAHEEVPTVTKEPSITSPTPPTPPPQPPQDIPSTSQGRMIAEMDQDDAVVLEDDKEEDRKVADAVKDVEEAKVDESAQEDKTEPAEVQEVVDIVTTAKLITKVVTTTSETVTAASAIITTAEAQVPAATLTAAPARVAAAPSRRRKGVVIRDPEEESTTSTIIPGETKSKDKGEGILVEEPKPLKKKQQIEQDEQYARELQAKLNKDIDWDQAIDHVKTKAKGSSYKNISKRAAKRRKLDVELEELKRNMKILPKKDDDVYTEATPLARKDLEALWSLVKERFSTAKPKNFFDDFLLTTLGAMFEMPDAHAQIWKNQRSIHDQAKVSLKLLESCGVHIITFTTTQLILLVERRYPLSRFTLDQMLNAVRLQVEEESEVSLELLRFTRQ